MNREPWTDEILMAYADGELEPPQALEVAQAAQGDAELARRIALFRASRRVVSCAYAELLRQPVPERLVRAAQGATAAPAGAVTAGRQRPAARVSRASRTALLAMAAGLAGLVAGQHLAGTAPGVATPGLAATVATLPPVLTDALGGDAAGEEHSIVLGQQSTRLLVVASYGDQDHFCRDARLDATRPQGHERVQLLACRNHGQWALQALADSAAAAPAAPAAGGEDLDRYLPAGGPPDLATALGLGTPLSAAAESALLRR